MARKKDSPPKAALREMMSIILEGALDQELDKELGYSKYDYHNKETDNSRNGHSRKPCISVMATWKSMSPETERASSMIIPGLFEPPVRTLRATIPENESHIFR